MNALLSLFAAANSCHSGGFFGLIPWWYYLPAEDFARCEIIHFNPLSTDGIPLILLAVIDDLLRVIAIVAVGFILYGAVQYMISQGNPEQTSKALKTIINALIGIGISTVAVALVSFLGNRLGGT